MGMTKKSEQEFAKLLYINEGLSGKEVAIRCNITEKTFSKWKNEFGWEKLKRSIITIKDTQITSLYSKLEKLNSHIEDTQENLVTSKDVDAIVKLTSSIKQLEVETSLGEIIDVAKKFIEFTRDIDLDFAKKTTDYFDMFIQTKVK